MSTTVDVNIKVTGAKKAAGEVGDVADKAEQGGEAISGMSGALDRMTGGMISGFQGMAKGLKNGVKGLKSFKMALISTGIGALVVLIGSLVAYFTQTRKGAEMLEKVMGGLGAVMGVMTDVVSALGEGIVEMFTEPQKSMEDMTTTLQGVWAWFKTLGDFIKKNFLLNLKAMEFGVLKARIAWNKLTGDVEETSALEASLEGVTTEIKQLGYQLLATGAELVEPFQEAWEEVKKFGEGLVDAYEKGDALAARSIKLREAQRDLKVAFAEGRAQIKEYNLVAEDTTKGLEERMEAAEKAIEIEKGLMAARQAAAAEELAIAKETAAISETTEDDLENIADLEAALIQIRTESAEMTTTLNNKLNTIRAQDAAEAQRLAAEQKALDDAKLEREKEFIAMKQTDRENEVTALEEHYARMLVLAKEFGMSKEEVERRQQAAMDALEAKWDKEDLDRNKKKTDDELALQTAKIDAVENMAVSSLAFLAAVNETAAQGTEREQKKAFERSKKIQIAQAIVSASRGIVNILSAASTIPDPFGTIYKGVQVALLAGTTAAQIAKIKQTQFSGGGSASSGGAAAGGGTASIPQMTEALVPTSFADSATAPTTGLSTGVAPVQAFVVSSSITNQQQLDATISHQSSL